MRWLIALTLASVWLLGPLVHAGPNLIEIPDLPWYNYDERIEGGNENSLPGAVKKFYEDMKENYDHGEWGDYPLPVMAAGMVVDGQTYICSSGSYPEGQHTLCVTALQRH
ncbi:hypothetical protein G7Y89_g7607 [Cudoniella acicularis]|uniref:Uncharacterized protein n=1 Tax=Cudoniella acicularis TaxID=354080 RepID=A0A8H4RIZ8_9HELO|nr:hypothetical protein G7Y89_g7607 [Cudoniella acicularis]